MANSYSTTPARKPPQAGGGSYSASKPAPPTTKPPSNIKNPGGGKPTPARQGGGQNPGIKSYMEKRGAKPIGGLGVSPTPGGLAKQRRMGGGQPMPPQNIRGRLQAQFREHNRVPTGGNTTPANQNAQAGMAAALRRRQAGAGGVGGQLGGLANRFGGNTGGPGNGGGGASLSRARDFLQNRQAMQQGHSTHPMPGDGGGRMPPVVAPKPGPVGSAQTMPAPKPTPSIQPIGGGGGTMAQGRQRPKNV